MWSLVSFSKYVHAKLKRNWFGYNGLPMLDHFKDNANKSLHIIKAFHIKN